VFERDFKQGKPIFEGKPVWWDRKILPGDLYEEGFWHLVQKSEKTVGGRVLDLCRAERLSWCIPVLNHANDTAIKHFDYAESTGRVRTYLWLVEGDYRVVLEQRIASFGEIMFLVSAHCIEYEHTRKDMQRKCYFRLGYAKTEIELLLHMAGEMTMIY
jgi:hypothetical protein